MRLAVIFCLIVFSYVHNIVGQSWQEVKNERTGKIDIYWYTSVPFIYEDGGNIVGIEYEILNAFQKFLLKEHDIELSLNWIKAQSFYNVMEVMKKTSLREAVGASAFSITEERQEYFRFTDSYLPDITVLISSQGTPIVHSSLEIQRLMDGMEAVTIRGTIYEDLLIELRDNMNLNFSIKYIASDENVLDEVGKSSNRFGFIDLPIYLMRIKSGVEIVRQNHFTVRGTGYGILLPKGSDWLEPFNEFLSNDTYKHEIAGIISKYLGTELFEIIDSLVEEEQLGTTLLTKEKEIQLALIKNANLMIEKEKSIQGFLIFGIVVASLFIVLIGYLFYNNQKNTKLLIEQNLKIEQQQNDIQSKNEQLTNRNAQLFSLNEDKNHLVSILAHDLRAPLGHIAGFSELLKMSNTKLSEDDKSIISNIHDASNRMNEMIIKILDFQTLDKQQNLVFKEKVDVNQMLEELVSRYQPMASKKQIKILLEEKLDNSIIRTDHLLLSLVLENLLSNAIKFSGSNTRVKLSCSKDENSVQFAVSDQGPGFSEKDKELIFKKFQKLSAKPTGDETSSGLGLSIVKRYVDDIGGSIWFESIQGEGTTFYVSVSA